MSHLYTHGLIIAKVLSPQKPQHDPLIDQIQLSEAKVSTTNTNALYLILICRQHQILKTMLETRHTNQKRPQFCQSSNDGEIGGVHADGEWVDDEDEVGTTIQKKKTFSCIDKVRCCGQFAQCGSNR